jgi:hypothetical protein
MLPMDERIIYWVVFLVIILVILWGLYKEEVKWKYPEKYTVVKVRGKVDPIEATRARANGILLIGDDDDSSVRRMV